MRLVVLLIGMCGCRGFVPQDGSDDTSAADDTAQDTDTDTDTDTDVASNCPDPAAALDGSLCDAAIIPAAAAYYVGDFSVAPSGDVGGHEYQYFFANPEHEANGGEDCVAVWTITGTRGDAAACDSCDFSLQIAGAVDFDASTCPDGLLYPRSFETTYDVREAPPGESTLYFPSGNELGQGCIEDARVTYASDGWCEEML